MNEVTEFLNFAADLEQMRVAPATTASLPPKIAAYLTTPTWRRHAYCFCIISIYGSHERFIRDICSDTSSTICKIYSSYSELPERLRTLHERLSIERAKDILDGRLSDYIEFQQALSNLHSCFFGSMTINNEVFSMSTANYRSSIVQEVIGRLDIKLDSADGEISLRSIIETELNGFYSSIANVIDDLARRRNEIAHGSDFDLLDLRTLGSILKAVYGYDCWVYREVAKSLLKKLVLKNAVEIGCVSKTYTSRDTGIRSIASIEKISENVRREDLLYLLHDGSVKHVIARTIQRLKIDIEMADPGSGPYGVDFEIVVKDGSRILRLPPKHTSLAGTLHRALEVHPLL